MDEISCSNPEDQGSATVLAPSMGPWEEWPLPGTPAWQPELAGELESRGDGRVKGTSLWKSRAIVFVLSKIQCLVSTFPPTGLTPREGTLAGVALTVACHPDPERLRAGVLDPTLMDSVEARGAEPEGMNGVGAAALNGGL